MAPTRPWVCRGFRHRLASGRALLSLHMRPAGSFLFRDACMHLGKGIYKETTAIPRGMQLWTGAQFLHYASLECGGRLRVWVSGLVSNSKLKFHPSSVFCLSLFLIPGRKVGKKKMEGGPDLRHGIIGRRPMRPCLKSGTSSADVPIAFRKWRPRRYITQQANQQTYFEVDASGPMKTTGPDYLGRPMLSA